MTQPMFHPDELRAQALAGFDRVGGNIYTSMPEQHREFFAALPYLFVATLDEQGWPVATLFNGPPGSAPRVARTTRRRQPCKPGVWWER